MLTLSQAASAQEQSAQELLARADHYRAQLEVLAQQVGRYDMQLLESLSQLAELLTDLNQFEDTNAVLDQAIQIARINEGLYTPSQFPLLLLKVKNDVRRGDWQDANDALDHLTWLYMNKYQVMDSALVIELVQLGNLHMEGVAGDRETEQADHFRLAEKLTLTAIQVAERIWPATDPRLVDLYYRLLVQHYLQAVSVLRGGEASQDLRQIVPGSGWMHPRDVAVRTRYVMGMEIQARMRQIYETADPPDLEALAMIDLYRADWQVMFDEGDAASGYQQAYARLVEAGAPETAMEAFFSRPRVLPMDNFYPSIALATEAVSPQPGAQTNELQFVEWSSVFPNVQLPVGQPPFLQEEIDSRESARLAIHLDGTEKVLRWVRGRYVSQVSVAGDIQVLDQSPAQALSLDELEFRLHNLTFRPVLVDGVPQSFEGILNYQYFPAVSE